jgi:cell division protein FtsB
VDLSLIKTLLPVLILLISGLIVAVRIQSQVKELQKDLDALQKRETYVVVVKLEAQMEQVEKNISALWTFTNSLRNRFNGH